MKLSAMMVSETSGFSSTVSTGKRPADAETWVVRGDLRVRNEGLSARAPACEGEWVEISFEHEGRTRVEVGR